jgi:translation initiation factor 1
LPLAKVESKIISLFSENRFEVHVKSSGSNHRLVYSSDTGRICQECGRPVNSCTCRKKSGPPTGDGIVRIRRETKGRGGKTVTVISGVPLDEAGTKALAGDLKKRCGTGGTVKDGIIEIQGDHRELLMAELATKGYRVKAAGG